jgi:hypothetical protein
LVSGKEYFREKYDRFARETAHTPHSAFVSGVPTYVMLADPPTVRPTDETKKSVNEGGGAKVEGEK